MRFLLGDYAAYAIPFVTVVDEPFSTGTYWETAVYEIPLLIEPTFGVGQGHAPVPYGQPKPMLVELAS